MNENCINEENLSENIDLLKGFLAMEFNIDPSEDSATNTPQNHDFDSNDKRKMSRNKLTKFVTDDSEVDGSTTGRSKRTPLSICESNERDREIKDEVGSHTPLLKGNVVVSLHLI